jgi:8-oxo-dGTP pyrophosphatase MutT (NUDIX family)
VAEVGAEVVGGRRFSAVLLVDDRGRILLQERDDGAPIDPDCWGLVGGHVEDGEDYEPAAYRELLEETGVVAAPGTLALWREFAVDHRYTHGTVDTMRVYVASTVLADADIVCGEGRQIVFVEPDTARRLPMTSAAADILPIFLRSDRYTGLRDPPG